MKRAILFIIITGFAIALYSYAKGKNETNLNSDIKPETTVETSSEQPTSSISYYTDKSKGIYIAKFNPNEYFLDLYIQPNKDFLESSEEVLKKTDGELLINAGYFREDFEHAGFLVYRSEILSDPALNDRQVTHILNLESLTFGPIKEIDLDILTSAFQTGPLIINNGDVEEELIQNSTNGNGNFRRSVLGKLDTGEVFFLATTKSYSLIDLSNEILETSFLGTPQIDAINLDGGSSVSIISSTKSGFKVGENKKLPFLLTVKKK